MIKTLLFLLILPCLLFCKTFDYDKHIFGIKPGMDWDSAIVKLNNASILYEIIYPNDDFANPKLLLNTKQFLGKGINELYLSRSVEGNKVFFINIDIRTKDLKFFTNELKKMCNKYNKKRDKKVINGMLFWDNIKHSYLFDNADVAIQEDVQKSKNHKAQHSIMINEP